MTFDNAWELEKIHKVYPEAELVLRIKTTPPEGGVTTNFSYKFGCPLEEVQSLLQKAKSLNMNVVGVSFHVGYRCVEPLCYKLALRDARDVFEVARKIGYDLKLVDLGGGYPGFEEDTHVSFESLAEGINEGLDSYYGDLIGSGDVNVIAEPGRFFAAKSHTLAAQIIGKSVREDE